MNMVADKIFVTVFTAFVAVVATASVIIAKDPVREDYRSEILPSVEVSVPQKAKFSVVSAEELLGDTTPAQILEEPVAGKAQPKVAHDVQQKVDVVMGQPVEMPKFYVLSADDLERVITKGIKTALKKDPTPMWREILGWTWFGIKLPYQALMMVPAEVRIPVMLYFILKFKPEIFGWGIKEAVKHSPGLGKFLFTEFGMPIAEEMAHVVVDGVKANVAEFVPTTIMDGMGNATATAAETAAQLANRWMPEWIQNFAISRGY